MHAHLNLPEPIAAYFAADKIDGEAVARCFTKDAVVKDEGHTYSGVAAIRQWKADASAKYHYTFEPGSPIDLRYLFQLERGKVANLEIHP